MDRAIKYAMGSIAVLICIFTVLFLNFLAHKKPTLLDRIATTFQSNVEQATLRDVANFDWTEVCIFRAPSSYPTVAYDAYVQYMNKTGQSSGLLRRRDYGIIFLFKTASGFEQDGFGRAYIKIGGKRWFLYAGDENRQSEHSKKVTACFRGNVTMRKYPDDLILLSGQKI